MFRRLWGPTVAAVSVVLDQSDEPAIVREALDGLLLTARIAAHHHVGEVSTGNFVCFRFSQWAQCCSQHGLASCYVYVYITAIHSNSGTGRYTK